ncbi:MAG: YbaB/EbfC family nucleoid-associated protein [Bacilli bacterium]
MNMQQLLAQAQKAQRELNKAQQALQEKEFEASANGGVTIKMNGKREILDLQIDPDLLDPSSKDMLQDMIKVALNNVLSQIEKESDAINDKVTGGMRF